MRKTTSLYEHKIRNKESETLFKRKLEQLKNITKGNEAKRRKENFIQKHSFYILGYFEGLDKCGPLSNEPLLTFAYHLSIQKH